MKNKTAKTKIIILSIIAILVILLVGFLIYRNKNKTEEGSGLFSDIFSILPSSRDTTEVEAIAGVAIQKNEPVYVSGVSKEGKLIVSPYKGDYSFSGEIYGYATKDFSTGEIGKYEANNNYKYGHDNTTKELIKTIDYKFECSDGIDNDGDGYIDADDPNCHAEGDINKEYLPNYYSEETTIKTFKWTDSKFPGGTEPKFPDGPTPKPKCSDGIDNDGDGDIDASDSACHLDGDINKEYLPDHFSESQYVSSYIDLTAGDVTYQTIKLDEPSAFYATITNYGTDKIEKSFNSFFSIKKVGEDVEDIKTEVREVPSLGPNSDFVVSMNFLVPDDTDEYKIRVCADKKDASDEGEIDELNENNNCGSWVSFKADTSFTPPGEEDLPECSDGIDNDGDEKIDRDDPNCREGGVLTGTYLPDYDSESKKPTECSDTIDNDSDGKIDANDPSCREGGIMGGRYLPNYNSESMTSYECNDTIDNDGDGKIDANDPECREGGTMDGKYIPTNDSEEIAPAKPNICLSLEPLEFTEEEKAKLDDLLRRFYLIAPELKDETSIKMVYQEIERYSGFKDEIQTLINSCYTETDNLKEEGYEDLIIQYGNPWYNYNKRGSYLEKVEDENIEKLKPQCVYSEEYEGIANADLFETYKIENEQQKISLCNSLGEHYQSRSMCEYYNSNEDIGFLVRGKIAEGLRRLWNSIFKGDPEGEPSFYMTGCKWISDDRVHLKEYEILLNVW